MLARLFGSAIVATLICSFASAQTITVKKENTRIRKAYAEGFEVVLYATFEEAESALSRLMKTFGKSKQADESIVVAEPVIGERSYTAPVHGRVKQLGNIVSAWVGFSKDEWSDKDAEALSASLEKIMYDFGVNFHREKIQKQIDEAIRAAQAVERQQQRLTNQNRDLTQKVEDNKREKIQLEKALENNKLELETLTKRLAKNQQDQDSVAVAGEQIQKAIEMHKERQRKVN